jgi:hypothetical protein
MSATGFDLANIKMLKTETLSIDFYVPVGLWLGINLNLCNQITFRRQTGTQGSTALIGLLDYGEKSEIFNYLWQTLNS